MLIRQKERMRQGKVTILKKRRTNYFKLYLFTFFKAIYNNYKFLTLVKKPPLPFFDLKIVYSYVIEVADSESNLCLCN